MDIKKFLAEYWDDIVALFDKIYAYLKELVEKKDEE